MQDFEITATGYRATDAQVAWWEARDTCPLCSAPLSPIKTADGIHHYRHDCDGPDPVTWTRRA